MVRELRTYVVLGFATTHAALAAEEAMAAAGIEVVPVPAPSTVSAMCGIALRVDPAEEGPATDVLRSAGIIIAARVETTDYSRSQGV